MFNSSSIYLSVLDNQYENYIDYSYDHGLDQKRTCKIYEQLPIVKQLKQNHPYINVEIVNTSIKPIPNGIYIGQLNHQNKPEGYGIIRYQDQSIVQAQFHDGKANGKGYKLFNQNQYYVGDFVDNTFDGRGQYKSLQISYIGQFRNNNFHGHGELHIFKNKSKFIGQLQNGVMKQGTLTWQIQNPKSLKQILKFQFTGTFNANGQFDGPDCVLKSNIGTYKGGFKNGQKHGQGRFQWKQKYQYIGNYENNVKTGHGALYNPQIKKQKDQQISQLSELQRNISYRGQFRNNLPHGKGQIYRENQGRVISAEYVQGIWSQALKGVNQ